MNKFIIKILTLITLTASGIAISEFYNSNVAKAYTFNLKYNELYTAGEYALPMDELDSSAAPYFSFYGGKDNESDKGPGYLQPINNDVYELTGWNEYLLINKEPYKELAHYDVYSNGNTRTMQEYPSIPEGAMMSGIVDIFNYAPKNNENPNLKPVQIVEFSFDIRNKSTAKELNQIHTVRQYVKKLLALKKAGKSISSDGQLLIDQMHEATVAKLIPSDGTNYGKVLTSIPSYKITPKLFKSHSKSIK